MRPPPNPTLFPYTTLFRSVVPTPAHVDVGLAVLERGIHALIEKPLADTLPGAERSEEHTSELQSHHDLVCRLLLEKKIDSPVYWTLHLAELLNILLSNVGR